MANASPAFRLMTLLKRIRDSDSEPQIHPVTQAFSADFAARLLVRSYVYSKPPQQGRTHFDA